jgi:hypothetical protein
MSDTLDTSSNTNYNAKHPDSSFAPEYPYNQASISRSGHEFHVDDTPGNERLRYYHTDGTGFEIGVGGTYTFTANNKAYNYYKDGYSTTVDGEYDIKVVGNINTNVDSDINQSSKGAQHFSALDEITIKSGSVVHIHTNTDLERNVIGNEIAQIDGNLEEQIGGYEKRNISGDSTETIGGNKVLSTTGDIGISATTSMSATALTIAIAGGTTVSITAAGKVTVNSPVQVDVISTGIVNVRAATTVNIISAGELNLAASGPINLNSATSIIMNAPIIRLD